MTTYELPSEMLQAHAATDVGRRDINEDAFICDADRGVFAVIDGVGGHGGGDVAAAIARRELELRLRRETGTVEDRIREAITAANEQILLEAAAVPALAHMACVLTVASIAEGRLVAGHVGDTRLYTIDRDGIRKLTRDHSPVGILEDQGQLTEEAAMRHPDRNQVFRDVGRTPHKPTDPEFIDIIDEPFGPDAALLLCSDGLTDLVPASEIAAIVRRHATDLTEAVDELIHAANEAGGKDNVTVVLAVGPLFASSLSDAAAATSQLHWFERPTWMPPAPADALVASAPSFPLARNGWRAFAYTVAAILALVAAFAAGRWPPALAPTASVPAQAAQSPAPRTLRVSAAGSADFVSIADAIRAAQPGDTVAIEPGTYAESITVREGVAIRSRQPRMAALRRPATVSGPWTAIVATDITNATVSGLVVRGADAAPLDYGVWTTDAKLELDDLEIAGARASAVQVTGRSIVRLRSSYLHDNPGGGVRVEAGALPEILHNLILRNGRGVPPRPAIELRSGSHASIVGNVIRDNGEPQVAGLDGPDLLKLADQNGLEVPAGAAPSKRR